MHPSLRGAHRGSGSTQVILSHLVQKWPWAVRMWPAAALSSSPILLLDGGAGIVQELPWREEWGAGLGDSGGRREQETDVAVQNDLRLGKDSKIVGEWAVE